MNPIHEQTPGTKTYFNADFGKTAGDYGRYRAGFPDAFFDRVRAYGIGLPGQRLLDLGTGTGTLARGFALRGCEVTGLDRSGDMIQKAKELDGEAGVTIRYVVGSAEETSQRDGSFDVVTAGQCWHWFHRSRAAREARRVLTADGSLCIAHFDWIPLPGNVADATEMLIEKHNPEWKFGGGMGLYPKWLGDLVAAGFREIETFSFDLDVPYSHEAWRGRIRASAGVGASLGPAAVEVFDAELAEVLKKEFPEDPLKVLHRVFAVSCQNREDEP